MRTKVVYKINLPKYKPLRRNNDVLKFCYGIVSCGQVAYVKPHSNVCPYCKRRTMTRVRKNVFFYVSAY